MARAVFCRPTFWGLGLLFIGGMTISALAEQKGLPLLDQATDLQLNADSLGDMEKVVDLCEKALKDGLDDENQKFAKQLASSTLYEIAKRRVAEIGDREQRQRRWQAIRELSLKDLDRARAYDDNNPSIHLMRARLLAMPGGDRAQAIEATNRAVKLLVDDKAELAAALLLRAGLRTDPGEQIADLNSAVEAEIEGTDALEARAMFFMSRGDTDKAIVDLKTLSDREPDNAQSRFALAMAFVAAQKYEEALAQADKVIESNPQLVAPYKLKAQIHKASKQVKEAIADLDKALQFEPQDLETLLMRAEMYESIRDFDRARADVEQVLQQRPGLPDAILQRASIFSTQKKFGLALADLNNLLKQDPKNVPLRIHISQLYLSGGWPRKSIEVCTAILKDEPSTWLAFRGRADGYLAIGKHAEAIADFEAALKIVPDNSGVLNNFAWVLATTPNDKLRNGKRAIELGTLACEATNFKESHILSTLAAGFAETGDFETAIKWSRQSVELSEGESKEQLKKELESYQQKKAWRELQQTEEGPNPPALDGDADL